MDKDFVQKKIKKNKETSNLVESNIDKRVEKNL